MTISVAPGAGEVAGDSADRFVVVVTGADDGAAAVAGLGAAAQRIRELGADVVSPVVLSPDGPLVRVGGLRVEPDGAEAVPDVVAAELHAAGVGDATVEVREPTGPLDRLDATARAAVLRAFPAPAGAHGVLPAAWLEVAAEWVLGGLSARERVSLRLLGAPFSVRAADAPAVLHAATAARTWCDLVQGDLSDRIRTASLTFGSAPHLALAAGGPRCDIPALLARFDLLCDVARDLGDAAYTCVDLEDAFDQLGDGVPGTGWPTDGGARPNDVAGRAVDVVVPDVHPFQVLGPGHVERLGRRRRRLGQPLPDGRLEVALGDPADWLPEFDTRDAAVARARKDLQALLVTGPELTELVAERAPAPRPRGRRAPVPAAQTGPDLGAVTIAAVPHPRRGLRLTLLELAAWIGGEPHSDAPASVSPVLAAYARWLATGLDDERRQSLVPYAARLVGTRATGLRRGAWRPLAPEDERRTWLAVEWLAGTHAPACLRAAGLDRTAASLEKVRPRRGGQHRPRLAEVLGRVLDELAALGSPRDDAVWDGWERASEASGWVAASEAAWIGIPDVLVSATEIRVQELAREPRRSTAALEAEVRTAAVAAVAEAAWRSAGRAAAAVLDAAADDAPGSVVTVQLGTALDRAAQGAAARLRLDRDAIDRDLELADAAAQDALGELVRSGRGAAAPIEVARAAAAASAGGEAWTTVQELTHGVLGDDAWQTGMVAASTATTRVLHHAAPLVDRAVLVAMARETAGLAARAAAAGGGPAVLDALVEELREPAVALLDALLDVR